MHLAVFASIRPTNRWPRASATTYLASFGQPPDRRELGLLSIRDLDGLECGYWDHTAVELHLELLDSFETS